MSVDTEDGDTGLHLENSADVGPGPGCGRKYEDILLAELNQNLHKVRLKQILPALKPCTETFTELMFYIFNNEVCIDIINKLQNAQCQHIISKILKNVRVSDIQTLSTVSRAYQHAVEKYKCDYQYKTENVIWVESELYKKNLIAEKDLSCILHSNRISYKYRPKSYYKFKCKRDCRLKYFTKFYIIAMAEEEPRDYANYANLQEPLDFFTFQRISRVMERNQEMTNQMNREFERIAEETELGPGHEETEISEISELDGGIRENYAVIDRRERIRHRSSQRSGEDYNRNIYGIYSAESSPTRSSPISRGSSLNDEDDSLLPITFRKLIADTENVKMANLNMLHIQKNYSTDLNIPIVKLTYAWSFIQVKFILTKMDIRNASPFPEDRLGKVSLTTRFFVKYIDDKNYSQSQQATANNSASNNNNSVNSNNHTNNNTTPVEVRPIICTENFKLSIKTESKSKKINKEQKIDYSSRNLMNFSKFNQWVFIEEVDLVSVIDLSLVEEEEEISISCSYEDINRNYKNGNSELAFCDLMINKLD